MAKNEGIINHYGAIRLRINGSASLQMRLLSMDEVKTSSLLTVTIKSLTNDEPTRLCNFTQNRASLEIKTTLINEKFIISKIVIFVKPVATGIPS